MAAISVEGLRKVSRTSWPSRSRTSGELVRGFSWGVLGMAVGGATFYAGLAVVVFGAGLRRYESGNRFGVRA